MGITALISMLLGLLGGVIPDVLKEVRESRASSREREFIELQHRLQMERMEREAGSKLREAEMGLAREELQAMRAQVVAAIEAGAKPSGVVWIDALNALIRPVVTIFVMMLFVVTAGGFVFAVLGQYQAGQPIAPALELGQAIWGSLVGFTIEAVFGFWFGARQTRKSPIGGGG